MIFTFYLWEYILYYDSQVWSCDFNFIFKHGETIYTLLCTCLFYTFNSGFIINFIYRFKFFISDFSVSIFQTVISLRGFLPLKIMLNIILHVDMQIHVYRLCNIICPSLKFNTKQFLIKCVQNMGLSS